MYHFSGKQCYRAGAQMSVRDFPGLGEQLRRARVGKGLSLEALAVLSGVSKNHIAAAEKGGNVSVKVLNKLAPHLGLVTISLSGVSLDIRPSKALVADLLIRRAIADLKQALDEVELNATDSEERSDSGTDGQADSGGTRDQLVGMFDYIRNQPPERQHQLVSTIRETIITSLRSDESPIEEPWARDLPPSANSSSVPDTNTITDVPDTRIDSAHAKTGKTTR
jgi:transcriptional regulator with XRE-family HTH domain